MRFLVWFGALVIRLGITLVAWGMRREAPQFEDHLINIGGLWGVHRETEAEFRTRALRTMRSPPGAGGIGAAREHFEAALPLGADGKRAARELLESYP